MPRVYRAVHQLVNALVGRREYRLVSRANSKPDSIERELNDLGRDGWRLLRVEAEFLYMERMVSRNEHG